jgi:hypothetical protein
MTSYPLSHRWEPLVDSALIERLINTSQVLHHPERREVVFQGDAPWEDDVLGFNSVVGDGSEVRLYYRASIPDRTNEDLTITAMAMSTNGGLSFNRPDLGLVTFQQSKRNNILHIGEPPFVPPPAFIDTNPDCPPHQRYKGLSARWQKLFAMTSPDGLHWQPISLDPLKMEGTFDTINTAFWDKARGCYRCYTRYFENLTPEMGFDDVLGERPSVVRAIQSSTSSDFINWSPVVHNVYIDDDTTTQLYTNSALPCPGAEHILLAFPNRYVQQRITRPSHPYPGVNDALFISSRDGITWQRWLEAWVRPGLDDLNWTERNNYPTWGIVETSPHEWSLYISEHYRHPGQPVRLRRLSIRPHGFVSIHAGAETGEMITVPLLPTGDRLELNFSTSAAGWLQVEVQDAQGQPIEGMRMAEMPPLFGDALCREVCWKSEAGLSSLSRDPIRLRFRMQDADIYAFRFSNR